MKRLAICLSISLSLGLLSPIFAWNVLGNFRQVAQTSHNPRNALSTKPTYGFSRKLHLESKSVQDDNALNGWVLHFSQRCGEELLACLPGNLPSHRSRKESSLVETKAQWWTREDFIWFQTFLQVLDGLRQRHEKFIRLSHHRMGHLRDQLDTYTEMTTDVQYVKEMDLSFRRALADGMRLAKLLSEKGHSLMRMRGIWHMSELERSFETCYHFDTESPLSQLLNVGPPMCSVNVSFEELFEEELDKGRDSLQEILLDTLCLYGLALRFKSVHATVVAAFVLRLFGGVTKLSIHMASVVNFAEDGGIEPSELAEHYQEFIRLLELSTSQEWAWMDSFSLQWLKAMFSIRLAWILILALLISILDFLLNFRELASSLVAVVPKAVAKLQPIMVQAFSKASASIVAIGQKAVFPKNVKTQMQQSSTEMSDVTRKSTSNKMKMESAKKKQLRRGSVSSKRQNPILTDTAHPVRDLKHDGDSVQSNHGVSKSDINDQVTNEKESTAAKRTRPQKRRTSSKLSSTPKQGSATSSGEGDRYPSRATRGLRATSTR